MGEDGPLVTDEGHYHPRPASRADRRSAALAAALNAIPGVVEHGLFIGMADAVVIGRAGRPAEVLLRGGARHPSADEIAELMRNEDA